jgi:two-component system phosphate regulon sensor histidine kinase PhoR
MGSYGLMQGTSSATIGRGFRQIVALLVWLVLVPTSLLLVVGILMLVFYQTNLNVLFGILVLALFGAMTTGLVLTLVFLRREAGVSKLQMDFVSKVSHELRTPLTSIRMFVEMLHSQRVTSPEEMARCMDVLARETARLTERIDRLLDWGRMEAGRRVYTLRRVPVGVLLEDALAAFDASTVGRSVPVEVVAAEPLPDVLADRSAIEDALLNLLTNAYKYTGDDKRITLGAAADERWVRIWVADNGIGIPHREQRRVFEKFYRVDERLSRAVEGTGLGLAIVMHVARAHRGRVELESEPGRGSTFTLLLPRPTAARLAAAERDDAGIDFAPYAEASRGGIPGGGVRGPASPSTEAP